jgi:hypothetical protein
VSTATCNADNSPVNAQSNAARQKAYRDRKRGGPSVGRWPVMQTWDGKTTTAPKACIDKYVCDTTGIGRTTLYMTKWLAKHAPAGVWEQLNEHRSKLKVAPAYRALKRQIRNEYILALQAEHRGEDPWPALYAKWNPRPDDEGADA